MPRTQFIYTYAGLLTVEPDGRLAQAVRSLLQRTAAAASFRERATRLLQRLRPTWMSRTP